MFADDLLIDWDREMDMLYVLKTGYNSSKLINMDSKKVSGIVKRMDPETRECVGFIIHGFSKKFGAYTNCTEDQLKNLMGISLGLSNECAPLAHSA